MKKGFLKIILMPILCAVLTFGAVAIADIADKTPKTPKRDQIVCTCGCGQKAVQCGDLCPVARELLKKFDKKHKGA